MVYFSASGTDLEDAVALYSQDFSLPSPTFIRSEKSFEWKYRTFGNELVTFRTNRMMGTVEAELGASDEFVVQRHRSGWLSFTAARDSFQVTTGLPVMLPNGTSTALSSGTDLDHRLVHIGKDFVRTVASEIGEGSFTEFAIGHPISAIMLASWYRTVDLAASVLQDEEQAGRSILAREVSRLVALSMLETFRFGTGEIRRATDGAEPASVGRAYAFVHENAHLPISPTDIARAAGLSVRSLQLALRRYRETSPIRLLRTVRLEHVHAQLLETAVGDATVQAIARSWGFVHLGRFAGEYNTRYGESPSQTLRR